MKTAASFLFASVLVSAVAANPLIFRGEMCNQAPVAKSASGVKPIASPKAATASDCQNKCTDNSSCQCFVFGLQAADSTPTCYLFAVPAAQVPDQGTDLHVFDKACGSGTVPTQAPTHDQPQGPAPSKSKTGAGKATGSEDMTTRGSSQPAQPKKQPQGPAPSKPKTGPGKATGSEDLTTRGSSQPAQPKKQHKSPAPSKPKTGAGKATRSEDLTTRGNSQPAQPKKPSTGGGKTTGNQEPQPAEAKPKTGGSGATVGQKKTAETTPKSSKVCGAAPKAASTTKKPSPFKTATDVKSQQDCLSLCKKTSGCQSCEFGKSSTNGHDQCTLFNVATSSLPSPGKGQSIVAFDVDC